MRLFQVIIETDICGSETYYCHSLKEVESLVFGIFTDWDPNEDTIEDIDNHLRERGAGSIDIKTLTK